jgi:anti-sigma B factor antagonist
MVDSGIDQGSPVGFQVSTQPSVELDASGWAVVTLRGEQDLFESKRSRAALKDGVTAGSGRVVVDLSEVTFGDSSLLGALVGAAKLARRHNSMVRVVTSDTRMVQKLKITGLHQVVRVFPTLPDALEGQP